MNVARKTLRRVQRKWAKLWPSVTNPYPPQVSGPHEYPEQFQSAETNYFYYGHHKCATNWMRPFLYGLCQRLRANYLIYRGTNTANEFADKNNATFHLYVNSWPINLDHMTDKDRGFHLYRDPRDALISAYYSWKYSHSTPEERHQSIRRGLVEKNLEEGLMHILDQGFYFDQVQDWKLGERPNLLDVRYEELVANEFETFRKIIEHLHIDIFDEDLRTLVEACSFKRLSRGREQGQENVRSHFRKGVAGDWKNYFGEDGPMKEMVYKRIGPLIERLGYEL